jgi:predicted amidohydrolase
VGRIGIAICYEIRFPEVIRTLALAGAELVVLPTAWPTQSSVLAEHFTRVRAAENFVYLLAANRPDVERGVQFLGRSSITGPMGERLTEAGPGAELIVAAVDPSRTHDKRIVVEEGVFEVSPWSDRRPALYKSISTP